MSELAYKEFLARKSQIAGNHGFAPLWLPDFLKPFQAYAADWSIRKGRCEFVADCGLGKTPVFLVWAENVVRQTNGRVLITTPLSVSHQTVSEGVKFGVEVTRCGDGKLPSGKKIIVTNYERLQHFNPDDFEAVVFDEASAIKAFEGKRRKAVTRFASKIKYRHLCTATAAPNDFIELGTASEALGELTQSEMLSIFFLNSDKKRHSLFKEGDFWNRAKWFFRPHSEVAFWRWVCSWARACRKPSDLGDFDDAEFILPPLEMEQHVVPTEFRYSGELFVRIAETLAEQREERKRTIRERCELVAKLVDHDKPAVVWCQYNPEGVLLQKLIPGSVEVAGRHSDEEKEERLTAFTTGQVRVLITKPKIGAWGLNWQHCGHHTFFPSHSFEQFYQALRRSLRFGRVGPVHCDVVATEGEAGVTENLNKKQRKADQMFEGLVREMRQFSGVTLDDKHVNPMEVPAWAS